jgi:hypothetical protein
MGGKRLKPADLETDPCFMPSLDRLNLLVCPLQFSLSSGNREDGSARPQRGTDLMKQAVVDYLIKPVRPEKLAKVVSKHTKGHFYKDQFKA